MPSRAMAMPEFETIPPVVTSIGSAWSNLPPPIGVSKGTGRTRMSATHEPHSTQSKSFVIIRSHSLQKISPLPLGEGQGVRADCWRNYSFGSPHPSPLPEGEGDCSFEHPEPFVGETWPASGPRTGETV